MISLTVGVVTALSIFLIVYHHAGYPILLRLLGRNGRRVDIDDSDTEAIELPSITILLPAFNEERYIADKIRNLAFLDYPKQFRLQFYRHFANFI